MEVRVLARCVAVVLLVFFGQVSITNASAFEDRFQAGQSAVYEGSVTLPGTFSNELNNRQSKEFLSAFSIFQRLMQLLFSRFSGFRSIGTLYKMSPGSIVYHFDVMLTRNTSTFKQFPSPAYAEMTLKDFFRALNASMGFNPQKVKCYGMKIMNFRVLPSAPPTFINHYNVHYLVVFDTKFHNDLRNDKSAAYRQAIQMRTKLLSYGLWRMAKYDGLSIHVNEFLSDFHGKLVMDFNITYGVRTGLTFDKASLEEFTQTMIWRSYMVAAKCTVAQITKIPATFGQMDKALVGNSAVYSGSAVLLGTFSSNLNNPYSNDFQISIHKFELLLRYLASRFSGFLFTGVLYQISSGSIVYHFDILLTQDSPTLQQFPSPAFAEMTLRDFFKEVNSSLGAYFLKAKCHGRTIVKFNSLPSSQPKAVNRYNVHYLCVFNRTFNNYLRNNNSDAYKGMTGLMVKYLSYAFWRMAKYEALSFHVNEYLSNNYGKMVMDFNITYRKKSELTFDKASLEKFTLRAMLRAKLPALKCIVVDVKEMKSDSLPGYAIALIVIFLLLLHAAVIVVAFLAWKRRDDIQRRLQSLSYGRNQSVSSSRSGAMDFTNGGSTQTTVEVDVHNPVYS